jgi:hypothetical protein
MRAHPAMKRRPVLCRAYYALAILVALVGSCSAHQRPNNARSVELLPIELDSANPERIQFGELTLLSAFELRSRDRRFGGLSGLVIGSDDNLYAVSDRGYWNSARMVFDGEGRLVDLLDWQIHRMLSPDGVPLAGRLRDAEALARDLDGSFLVAFETIHRIWRYGAPPLTVAARPRPVPLPTEIAQAPANAALEAVTVLPDGRLLMLSEKFLQRDGTSKAWLLDKGVAAELSYVPSRGFSVTDCAAFKNGDVVVLERRYVPLGILSARLKLVRGGSIRPGAKVSGAEILALEYPLDVDNFEGIAVHERPGKGTMIFVISDDNYHPLQRTLLLQFMLK